MLHEFLRTHRERTLALARSIVANRVAPRATAAELDLGLAAFMDQLVDALTRSGGRSPAIEESATAHGARLLRAGFSYAQVVHDYGNVCQAVTSLAEQMNAPITPDEFRTLNRCVDEAVAAAITEYARLRDEAIDVAETDHLGALARGLRHPLAAAVLAYQVLKTGTVGVGGSTGAELGRNLRRVSALIDRKMAQVRLDAGARSRERVSVFTLMEGLEVGAALEADARGLSLTVIPVALGVDVDVDRQLLTAAVSNLIQNALQFTRPGGHVVVDGSSTEERVRIEVKDQCGGLPPGVEEALSGAAAPAAQRGFPATPGAADRPLGPGLVLVQRSVVAMGAALRVHDTPGAGCIFILDLPREPKP